MCHDIALKFGSKCSFMICKLYFFIVLCLVLRSSDIFSITPWSYFNSFTCFCVGGIYNNPVRLSGKINKADFIGLDTTC